MTTAMAFVPANPLTRTNIFHIVQKVNVSKVRITMLKVSVMSKVVALICDRFTGRGNNI